MFFSESKSSLSKKTLFSREEYLLNLPKNLKKKDKSIFSDIQKRTTNEIEIFSFKNAQLVHDSIFCNLILMDFLTHAIRLKFLAKMKRYIFKFFRQSSTLESGVWIIDNWSNNYYHWNSEALARLVSCAPYLTNHPVLLPLEFKGISFIDQSLKILGFKIFYFNKNQNYTVRDLISISKAGYVIDFQKNSLLKLRNAMWTGIEDAIAWRKVYISRKNANHRKVLNEEEVIGILKNYDFEIVYFELLSILDQIKLMRQTKVLVGLHGAGMVNMLYMPSNGKILEFRNRDDSWVLSQSFYSLASIMDHDYYYTDNYATSNETGFADFQIDCSKLERVMKDII